MGKIVLRNGSILTKKAAEKMLVEKLSDDGLTRRLKPEKIALVGNPDLLRDIATAWSAADPERTEAAIRQLNQQMLTDLVLYCESVYVPVYVRSMAMRYLSDQTTLENVARTDPYSDMRMAAVKMLKRQCVLKYIALNDTDVDVREEAVAAIKDQKMLEEIATSTSLLAPRVSATRRIKRQAVLRRLINDPDEYIQLAAVSQLTSKSLLEKIATDERRYWKMRLEAINKIDNQDLLFGIASNKRERLELRCAAVKQIASDEKLMIFIREYIECRPQLTLILKEELSLAEEAMRTIHDVRILVEMVQDVSLKYEFRESIIRHIGYVKNSEALVEIIENVNDTHLQVIAVDCIPYGKDEILFNIALTAKEKEVRKVAAEKLNIIE